MEDEILNPETPEAPEAEEPTGFEGLEPMVEESAMEQGFADAYDQQQAYFSEKKTALNTTTLLTALASTDPSKNISYQLTEQALEAARGLLKAGNEKQLRYQLVQESITRQTAALGGVIRDLKYSPDPALAAGAEQAYRNVLQFDAEKKSRTAIEEAAVDRIRTMAARDPIQARILLNNLEFGNADQVVRDFSVKLSMLNQLAEEYDAEYQESGWGRFVINQVLNVIPGNFGLQRSGIVGKGSFWDFFQPGSGIRNQSEDLLNMPLDELAEYIAKGGEFRASMDDNATSYFEIADPGAKVQLMHDLIGQSDSTRNWNNGIGAFDVLSVLPWTKLASVSRILVASGDAASSARNVANGLKILDDAGPEAMTRATGLTEKEIVDELSVGAVKGTDDFVPLSEPVASHMVAAEQAAKEIFNAPEMSSFRSMDEIQDWIAGRVAEIRAIVGSPVKDIHYLPRVLPGGKTVYRMGFTVGIKSGFGAASAAAMKRELKRIGFAGREVFEESTSRTVPKFEPKSRITNLSSTTEKQSGNKAYTATLVRPEGDPIPVSLYVENGRGRMEITGLDQNQVGPAEMRGLLAQLADEIPDLKTVEGPRSTGARAKARADRDRPVDYDNLTVKSYVDEYIAGRGRDDARMEQFGANNGEAVEKEFQARAKGSTAVDDVAVFDVTKLRGQTRIERDMSGQFFAKIEVDMPEAGWLVGKLEPPQQGFVSRMIGRWTQAAPRTTDGTLHGQAIQAGTYLNRSQKDIETKVFGVFRKLPKQSQEIVRDLGKIQTIRAKWLTPNEINVLVDRQLGRAATEAEHKAMQDLRLFDDMDHRLIETVSYLDGLNKGKESVKFKTKWGQEVDEDLIIDRNMSVVPTDRVYDASRGKHYVHGRNSLDTKTLATMKNNGYVMMTFPEGFTLPEGIIVNKVLIKKTDIEVSPLRTNQLAYAEGGHRNYVASVLVKQGRKGVQADTGTSYLRSPSTFRTAENIAEGRRWADTMNVARLAVKENRGITAQALDDDIFRNQPGFPTGEEFLAGVTDETYGLDEAFEAVYDRELPSMYNEFGPDVARMFNEDELGINGYYRTTGRMYTSSKGEMLRDTKGELAEILDPYDALNRSLNQVTRQLGLFAYKQNAVERFVNTYGDFLKRDSSLVSPSEKLLSGVVDDAVSLEMRNQIESQRAAITNVLRFETPADRAARQRWQAVTANVLGDGTNAGRKAAHDALWWVKNNDPLGSLRSFAFDIKLGMFNIGQLLIQSSTMASALAMSPKLGMYGMAGLYPMHHYIIKGGSENILEAMTKRGTWKTMGFNTPEEFKDYARHAYKNGFMQMNGSHIMINHHGPQAHFGGFGEKVNAAKEQARVFFYTAETWNRLVAYRIAWGEAAAKGLKPNAPEFSPFILKTADDYSFNMTGESAAYWQKGFLSIPTQFWAYNMRMIDAMFGKNFAGGYKRARLIGMNLGIAGTAGIPGLAGISEYIKQKNGKGPDIDSLEGVADRGVIDFLNYKATGNDVLIGDRIGTGGWATDIVKTLFGQSNFGGTSFIDVAGGATYSISKNTSKTIWNLAKYAAAESGAEGAGEITKESFITLMKEVSTFSNISKAMMIHQHGMLVSNKGTVMVSDLPPSHAVYAALSFRPAKADEIGYMLSYNTDKADALKDFSKQLRNWRQQALVTGDYEKYWTKANTLMRLVPVGDRQEILNQANSLDDKSFYDYLEEKVSEEQAEEEVMEGLE